MDYLARMKVLYELVDKTHPCIVEERAFQVCNDGRDLFNGIYLDGVFNTLVKETGRLCDSFAGDIFYTLESIDKACGGIECEMLDWEPGHIYRKLIGIRELGVDDEADMSIILFNYGTYGPLASRYRTIYMFEVEVPKGNDLYAMRLYKVDADDVDYQYRKMDKSLLKEED